MRVVCPAAASGHPGLDELASRPSRGGAHIMVGTIENLRGQFRGQRACHRRRHALIWKVALNLDAERFVASEVRLDSKMIVGYTSIEDCY